MAKRIDLSVIEIIPHPYTYLPAIAYRTDSGVEWFDCRTGQELPPYYGYGANAQQKVDEWYQNRQTAFGRFSFLQDGSIMCT